MPKIKFSQKAADFVVKTISSWKFLMVQSLILTIWISINTYFAYKFDPYPFILMNLFLSMQAAYTAPIILMSQKRQDERSKYIISTDLKTDKKTNEDVQIILIMLEELKEKLNSQPVKKKRINKPKENK